MKCEVCERKLKKNASGLVVFDCNHVYHKSCYKAVDDKTKCFVCTIDNHMLDIADTCKYIPISKPMKLVATKDCGDHVQCTYNLDFPQDGFIDIRNMYLTLPEGVDASTVKITPANASGIETGLSFETNP